MRTLIAAFQREVLLAIHIAQSIAILFMSGCQPISDRNPYREVGSKANHSSPDMRGGTSTDEARRQHAEEMIYTAIKVKLDKMIEDRASLIGSGRHPTDPDVSQLDGSIRRAQDLLNEYGKPIRPELYAAFKADQGSKDDVEQNARNRVSASQGFSSISDCELSSLQIPGKALSVALIDFRVGTDAPESGRALADIARDVVQRTKCFAMLDRENMVNILGEQDLANAVKCDESRCLVKYGRLLSVQRLIHGRVSKLGTANVIYLALTDVETAEIVATSSATIQGGIENVGILVPDIMCRLLHDALAKANHID